MHFLQGMRWRQPGRVNVAAGRRLDAGRANGQRRYCAGRWVAGLVAILAHHIPTPLGTRILEPHLRASQVKQKRKCFD